MTASGVGALFPDDEDGDASKAAPVAKMLSVCRYPSVFGGVCCGAISDENNPVCRMQAKESKPGGTWRSPGSYYLAVSPFMHQ